MFAALDKFENEIAAPYDQDAVDFRRALAVVTDQITKLPADIPNLKKPMPSKLCHLMAMYKLIDILHAIDDPSTIGSGIHPNYPRMQRIGISEKNDVSISIGICIDFGL